MNTALTLDQKVLSGMATAMFNESYCRRKADTAARRDLLIRCFGAAMGTGAVVAWSATLTGRWALLWKALSIGTALLAALSPILRLDEVARRWLMLAGKWTVLVAKFRQLDESAAPEPELQTSYLALMLESDMLQVEDFRARDARLATVVQAEVRQHLSNRFPAQ